MKRIGTMGALTVTSTQTPDSVKLGEAKVRWWLLSYVPNVVLYGRGVITSHFAREAFASF